MTKSSDDKRRVWFDLGVKAFTLARPGAPQLYCCPLCIRGFVTPAPEVLSFEDVPPRSVGGKPLVLTCRKCNNTQGSELDSHIKAGRDLGEILEGKRSTPARLILGEGNMAVTARLGPQEVNLVEVPGKSHPRRRDALASGMEDLMAAGPDGGSFKLQFSTRHDEWRERVAWLRVAYLYLFALLGYSFILRPELNPIRDQIQKPDEQIVPQVIRRMVGPSNAQHIVAVFRPACLRGMAVQLGKWMLFFPGFLEKQSFYDRLAELPDKGAFSLSGRSLEFPTKPVFACDIHPELMGYLIPPNSNPEGENGV